MLNQSSPTYFAFKGCSWQLSGFVIPSTGRFQITSFDILELLCTSIQLLYQNARSHRRLLTGLFQTMQTMIPWRLGCLLVSDPHCLYQSCNYQIFDALRAVGSWMCAQCPLLETLMIHPANSQPNNPAEPHHCVQSKTIKNSHICTKMRGINSLKVSVLMVGAPCQSNKIWLTRQIETQKWPLTIRA